MEATRVAVAGLGAKFAQSTRGQVLSRIPASIVPAPYTATLQSQSISKHSQRHISTTPARRAPGDTLLGSLTSSAVSSPSSYFQRPSLPANTIIRFVPQQTAWIVERMGKFNRILQPGLAILIPFLDRIAYVKSLKEAAIEIPSQSAITADNVTLELDGVLYTRVFDAYKARYGTSLPASSSTNNPQVTESKTPNTQSLNWLKPPCVPKLASCPLTTS